MKSRIKNILNRIFSPVSAVKSSPRQTDIFGPLKKSHRFAIGSKTNSVGFIVCLICFCGPFAVFFAVTMVNINSIYGHSRTSYPHIGKEVFKLLPSLANSYPSTAIIFERNNSRQVTSIEHVTPYSVCSSPSHSMRSRSLSNGFSAWSNFHGDDRITLLHLVIHRDLSYG
jgi:hypothetical protein